MIIFLLSLPSPGKAAPINEMEYGNRSREKAIKPRGWLNIGLTLSTHASPPCGEERGLPGYMPIGRSSENRYNELDWKNLQGTADSSVSRSDSEEIIGDRASPCKEKFAKMAPGKVPDQECGAGNMGINMASEVHSHSVWGYARGIAWDYHSLQKYRALLPRSREMWSSWERISLWVVCIGR